MYTLFQIPLRQLVNVHPPPAPPRGLILTEDLGEGDDHVNVSFQIRQSRVIQTLIDSTVIRRRQAMSDLNRGIREYMVAIGLDTNTFSHNSVRMLISRATIAVRWVRAIFQGVVRTNVCYQDAANEQGLRVPAMLALNMGIQEYLQELEMDATDFTNRAVHRPLGAAHFTWVWVRSFREIWLGASPRP